MNKGLKYTDIPSIPSTNQQVVTDSNAIKESIERLLLTDPGSLVDNPDYGCGLRKYLFDPVTKSTINFIVMEVFRSLLTWEPRVSPKEIKVVPTVNSDGFTIFVTAYIAEFDTTIMPSASLVR